MLKIDDSPHSKESISRLSEIVIGALKEISSKKLPLTSATLSHALGSNKDFSSISMDIRPVNTDLAEVHPPTRADMARLKEDIRTLQGQKDRLARQLNEMEAGKAEDDQFFRRTLMTMLTLMLNAIDDSMRVLLLRFRELLRADAELTAIKEFYGELKDKVLAQGVCDAPDGSGEEEAGNRWSRFFQGKKAVRHQGKDDAAHCRELQKMYRDILTFMPPDLKFSGWQRLQALEKVLCNNLNLEQMLSLREEFVFLVQSAFQAIVNEKKEIVDFLSEMGNNLAQIESILFASLGSREAQLRANVDFGRVIEGHMDEIRESLVTADSLSNLKKLVATKLTTIKVALEARRSADSEEVQKVKDKLGGLQERFKTVRDEIDQVQKQAKKLEQEVLQDALTGINNRRAYEKKLQEEFQRYQRYGQVFSLMLFDVDNFKGVNDSYGHTAGDRCLKEIIKSVQRYMRVSDFVARYGGDEFVVILPGIGKEGVSAVGEKVRMSIERLRFLFQGKPIPLSVSIGGTEIYPTDSTHEVLFERADGALYKAKQEGRNRVVVV